MDVYQTASTMAGPVETPEHGSAWEYAALPGIREGTGFREVLMLFFEEKVMCFSFLRSPVRRFEPNLA